jgi:hypothetical protein
MVTNLHVRCLVAVFGGSSVVPADCALVLSQVPPVGRKVFLVATKFDRRYRTDGEGKTRIFTTSVVKVDTSEGVDVASAQVLVGDLHEMVMSDGVVVIGKAPYDDNAKPLLDRIGAYTSGQFSEWSVALYESSPLNEFLVERLLRQQAIVRERDAKIESLKEALAQCAVPDTVRKLANALTPSALNELLEFVRRSVPPVSEQG